jgi:pimeloyl-ACP methyl ester carboxylesterase
MVATQMPEPKSHAPAALRAEPGQQRPATRRPKNPVPAALRYGLSALSRISTDAAAALTEQIFFAPPRPSLSQAVIDELDRGQRLPVKVDGHPLAAWSYGSGPTVVLMHGWGGYAGQLYGFISPLLTAGLRVVALDAQSHGLSRPKRRGLRRASFLDFAQGLRALEALVGPFHGIVAHSGGATATGLALARGMQVDRAVLIAPMARPERYAERFGQALGLSEAVDRRWKARAVGHLKLRWDDLDLTLAGMRSRLPRALVIHDREDREVPWTDGRAIAEAWPGTELVLTAGLGHRRLLAEEEVIRRAMEFLRI